MINKLASDITARVAQKLASLSGEKNAGYRRDTVNYSAGQTSGLASDITARAMQKLASLSSEKNAGYLRDVVDYGVGQISDLTRNPNFIEKILPFLDNRPASLSEALSRIGKYSGGVGDALSGVAGDVAGAVPDAAVKGLIGAGIGGGAGTLAALMNADDSTLGEGLSSIGTGAAAGGMLGAGIGGLGSLISKDYSPFTKSITNSIKSGLGSVGDYASDTLMGLRTGVASKEQRIADLLADEMERRARQASANAGGHI